MELSLTKLLLVAFVVLIVFGGGKFPQAMKDLGKGIRKFKEGLNSDEPDTSKKSLESKDEDKKS